jgi:hypothetical protein
LDEQELRRRYYEHLSDWSEPGAVKINRNGKLLEPDESEEETLDIVEPTETLGEATARIWASAMRPTLNL